MNVHPELIASYQRRVRQVTAEMFRAGHLGYSEDAIARVLAGDEVESPPPLVPLQLALASAKEGRDRLLAEGLSEGTLHKIAEDASQVIREEWTYGIPADDLVPIR